MSRASLSCGALIVLFTIASPAVFAQSDAFYRAYYLEHEKQEYAAAARLYSQVIDQGPAELHAKAAAGLAACREEVASQDFARLMRPETIAYIELSRPGKQLARLAEKLGLLRGQDTADGSVGISPSLLEGLLGIRGVAIGISGFDAMRQVPRGILIAHPGDVDVIRGLIESALPVAARPVDAIRGYATYAIEQEVTVYVTLTSRLVLVSPQRTTIEETIGRMSGQVSESLADVPELSKSLARRGDGLIYFGLNFQRLLPLVQPLIAMAAQREPELAMVLATCDLQSLESVSGNIGVGDEGLTIDVDLELKDGHRNLVYNFFRMPAIDDETLRCVPHGVAGFITGSLNERRPAAAGSEAAAASTVSFMDIGRELFGNVVGVAAYATKTEGELIGGEALPGMALVFTVNDPQKSEALWTQFLGIAAAANSGAANLDGVPVEFNGVAARRFDLPEGISMYLARSGRTFILSPSQQAIGQSVAALRGGQSVLSDAAFRAGLDDLGDGATFAAFVHPRRCLEIARPHMSDRERRELDPFLGMLESTVASLKVIHSNEILRFSGLLSGIPRVGPLLDELVQREVHGRRNAGRPPAESSRPEF